MAPLESWQLIGTTDNGGDVFMAPVGTPVPGGFVTKDSGERDVTDSGYQRDTQKGKPRFDLMWPEGIPYKDQFLTRFAELLARGVEKYGNRNWERANQLADLERFKASAERHLIQWKLGEIDEDHGAAAVFNILAHETIKYKLQNGTAYENPTPGHRDESEPSAPVESVRPGQHIPEPADGILADDLLGSEVVSEPEDDLPEDDDCWCGSEGWWNCRCN